MAAPRKTPSAPAPARRGSVRAALKQARPFTSPQEEALVGLLLTAETLRWPLQDLLTGKHDLTLQQYNVLRILRGAGAGGLPTLEIGDRMIERTPGITRLLDRLEQKGLIVRERPADDRRRVVARITPAGTGLLRRLDRPIQALHAAVLGHLRQDEIRDLIRLLDQARAAPRS